MSDPITVLREAIDVGEGNAWAWEEWPAARDALTQVENLVRAARATLGPERQRPVRNLDANQDLYRALAPFKDAT